MDDGDDDKHTASIHGSIIRACNPSLVPFLPPPHEFPDFTLEPSFLKGEMNLVTYLFDILQRECDEDSVMIECDDRPPITYRHFINRCLSLASSMSTRGVGVGSRVLVLVDYHQASLESIIAAIHQGALACQDTPHSRERVQHLIRSTSPKLIFVDAHVTDVRMVLETIDEGSGDGTAAADAFVIIANPRSTLEDGHVVDDARVLYLDDMLQASPTLTPPRTVGATVATMFHTSGSTGMPKGCVATHATLIAGCKATRRDPHTLSTVKKGDKFYSIPPTNAYSFMCIIYVLSMGGTLVFSKQKDIPSIMSSLSKGVTYTAGTPPWYNKIRRAIKDDPTRWKQCAASLRACVTSGEHHTAHFAHEWKEVSGVDLVSMYGSTECNLTVCTSIASPVPGSMGRPLHGIRIAILDNDYNVLPPNTPGLLAFKSYGGCIYWNNLEKQSFYVHNGWNIPRDICQIDGDGCVWYTGRVDDLIITKSGGNVSAIELEGIVQRDPRVAEVAVVGKRTYESTRDDADVAEDREDGKLTLIIAVVVTPLHLPTDLQGLKNDLQALVEQHSEFSLDDVQFVASIPKLPNGKMNRKAL